ncbi:MAG: choice-of-anchor R domain-containing protein [Planctomycetota bacterium]
MTRCLPANVGRLCGIAVLCSAVGLVSQPARATVVFGNLGAAGTDAISGTNTDFGPGDANERSLAQGFTTGSSSQYLTVTSISMGLFASSTGTENRTVSIFSDSSGVPGSAVFTSAVTPVGNTGTYTFNFSNAVLSPSTSYWVVPQGPASWYLNNSNTAPAGLNSSGYVSIGTKLQNTSSQWVNATFPGYTVSVVAVPEPTSVGLLAAAGLAGGFALVRRRR